MDTANQKRSGRQALTSVGIVIVTWNGLEHTLQSLEAVLPQAARLDAPVTVVDNGSTDGTGDVLRKRYPSVKVVPLERNTGFTGGVRAGIEATPTDAIVLLNNDAIPREGWLLALTSALAEAAADVIAVSGRIIDFVGQKIDFIGGILTFDGHAFQRHYGSRVGSVPEPKNASELLFACGGNMILRRHEFLELGGFDDSYFAYLEDVDFGWRSWIAGYRILYCEGAVVRHRSSATSDTLGAFERGVLFERNALWTALKNFDDEVFRETSGAIFLTLLHRLHTYVVERNGDASALVAAPIGESAPPPPDGLFAQLKNFVRRAPRHAEITDDLTRMQFRAMSAIFESFDQIAIARQRVQSLRKRSDLEIFQKFPLHFIPTYPGDETLFSRPLFRMLAPRVNTKTATLAEIMQR